MLDLLIGSLSEIKSYTVVLSFYIKMMKQRIFQAYSLKHSIKKGMFYVHGKLNFFKSGRGGVLPPLPSNGYTPAVRIEKLSIQRHEPMVHFLLHVQNISSSISSDAGCTAFHLILMTLSSSPCNEHSQWNSLYDHIVHKQILLRHRNLMLRFLLLLLWMQKW